VEQVVTALIRGSFEYQGQKCSAASRAYIPAGLWPRIRQGLEAECEKITMGPPTDFTHLVNAVIDRSAFASITEYIEYAKSQPGAEVIIGGGHDDSIGYFIEPTIILAEDPLYKTMVEEIFGPVLTIYVYQDAKYEETLRLCDQSTKYALTGAIFAQKREAVSLALKMLENTAGNFYINDKPTGAVVGQQPFGGGRASGTNDKAGSYTNLLRWVSPRTIKETFVAPIEFSYPFMALK
jgi:1-pyrroline-5-carboxylate dehydrogenase